MNEQQYVLILHYIDGHDVPRWCAKAFCQSPKEMADFIENNIDDLYHQLDDEYGYYSIERRVGIYDRHDVCDGDLETLIELCKVSSLI